MKKNFPLSFPLLTASAIGLVCLLLGMKTVTQGPPRLTIPSIEAPGVLYVRNPGGPTLGYVTQSGVKILVREGRSFKDLNKNGVLDKYEDWRLPVQERALDLSAKLSIAQIAGLMLYSAHQAIPAASGPFAFGTYKVRSLRKEGLTPPR